MKYLSQKYINVAFRELIASKMVLLCIDDLIIVAGNADDTINNLHFVLNIAIQYDLYINWKKNKFLKTNRISLIYYWRRRDVIREIIEKSSEKNIAIVTTLLKPIDPQAIQFSYAHCLIY